MAIITLSFDDCSQETVKYALDVLGKDVSASFNIVPGFMNKKLFGNKLISWKDTQLILKKGHEITSHGYMHAIPKMTLRDRMCKILQNIKNAGSIKNYLKRLTTEYKTYPTDSITKYALKKEISDSKKAIEQNIKKTCNTFVYPGGKYNKKAIQEIIAAGYSSARGTTFGLNYKRTNKYLLNSFVWYNNTSLKEANNWVKKAIAKDAWLIECFHTIGDKRDLYEIKKEIFEKHLKFIIDSGIEIKTQEEAIKTWMNQN